ncbi:MAG: hypothetical protein ACREUT_20340 [Steroidobacteraceae bacterium]
MPSAYLEVEEGPAYGLSHLDSGEIARASILIDAHLKRPEGLVWMPDAQGAPCYMAALDPVYEFTLAGAIAPGTNVPVTLGDGPASLLQPGDVLILDRENEQLIEACTVATTTGPAGQLALTLQNVLNAHAAQATAQYGLVIEQQRYMPSGRPLTFASRTPLVRILSGVGRYAYGRRGDVADWSMNQYNLLAAMSKFGGPPVWELWIAPLANLWDVRTGNIWVPAGVMLEYYSEIKIRYVAGFPQSAMPPAVKLACARIIRTLREDPGIGNWKSIRAGDTSFQRAATTLLDEDLRVQLRPYAARLAV